MESERRVIARVRWGRSEEKADRRGMRISLILSTISRVAEVERLLSSLVRQDYADYDVIVADQNLDDRLSSMLDRYDAKMKIKHMRSEPGLSRARNAALPHADGDVIGFPDDDCVYQDWLLGKVNALLTENPWLGGVTGRTVGLENAMRFHEAQMKALTPFNVWRHAISYTIFLRRDVVQSVGAFDETLGVGAGTPWGAGEETDFLLRAISLKNSIAHHPGLSVSHPDKSLPSEEAVSRAYRYSCGVGRVLSKNKALSLPAAYSIARTSVGLGAALVSGNRMKMRIAGAKLRGKLRGLLS